MAATLPSSPIPPSSPMISFTINNPNQNPPSSSSPFQNLKPSILVILLILSITFLLSISLCLLLRHLNRRCLRNVSTSSTISTSAAALTSSSNRVSPEINPVISLIDSLPVFAYSSIKRRSATSNGDCAVCLSKFEPEDQLRLLPLCFHAFHVACIDTWLQNNQTCPLCRSPIHASDADILKALSSSIDGGGGGGGDSFRLEIGSISRRQTVSDTGVEPRSSYSVGSFDYVVDDESEVNMSHTRRRSGSDKEIGAQISQEFNLTSEVGAGRSWLKEYVDRLSTSLSSRALSFRSSGRFFTGSSRRSEIGNIGDYDVEVNRVGEEISEMFRWFSGV
ncbi:E3 ubiquitin-protein ligase ATL4 [Euphorbia lathyris]|uniref:E3 ubiquitin-protein ligase ATL4 n=1 Tax=Euphorbia lathyris TaxID=212925 RepID=UPI003313C02F